MAADNVSVMRFTVHGRVQGVGFRAATERRARGLGLDGWVANAGDGSVVGVACGASDMLKEFHAWLLQGPPAARVERVNWHPADEACAPGFEIRG